MRRVSLYLILGSLLALAAGLSAEDLAFKQTLKIPFAMKAGDLVIKPGKYVVRVTTESGRWKLMLAPEKKSTEQIVTVFGKYVDIPKEDRDFKKEYRLQILRMTAGDGAKTVVFRLDMRPPSGEYYRVLFELPAAD